LPTLLITGVSGYLGAALVRAASGWEIAGTYREHEPPAGVRPHQLDVRDADAVATLIGDIKPDVVIHTAYQQDGPDAWAINVEGAENVARAAGARLVHLSTDVVFSGDSTRPLHEDDPVAPVTDYGRSKAEAERRVAAADPAALIVRTSLLYGGPDASRSKHEELVLDVLRTGRAWTFYEDEIRCPIQVDDLAAALLQLATTPQAGPLHVAGPDAVDRLTFARLVAQADGLDPDALRGAPAPPDRPKHVVLDCRRARSLLRTAPRGIRDVLS
jgi:dTDP-4-dehydrorhamnose reductase